MWIFLGGLLVLLLLLLCLKLFKQKSELQQKLEFFEPLIETVENARDILYYCETVPQLNYLYLSPSVNELIGPKTLETHLINPDKIFEIVHPDDKHILIKKLFGQLDFKKPIKVRFKNHLGQYIWFEEYSTPIYKNGKFVAVQGIIRNIDDKVSLQKQLEYKSTHDPLTDLYNRAFFQMKMDYFNELEIPIAVVIADLDELKPINDTYGHQMGDLLIREAAKCLMAYADKDMIVARIGGDEFAIMMPNADVSKVESYIKKVKEKLLHIHGNLPISSIKMSIGYAHGKTSYGIMNELLTRADANMYREKNRNKLLEGKNKKETQMIIG